MASLLLTPLPAEFAILAQALQKKWSSEKIHKASQEALYFSEANIYLALGGHGKVEMALRTQFWLQQLKDCSRMACIGCAGSLTPSVGVGDVLVATKTIEHDFKQLFIKKNLPTFPISEEWKAILTKNVTVSPRFGIIASGDEDVLTEERRKTIHNLTLADAVAWEGAGAARACAFAKVPFCEIRAIVDDAKTDLKQDFTKNLNQAMLNLSKWLVSIL